MPGKDHINYSAGDIARYHRGEMSAAERHAMEKAALDDPFLADAIEGYAFSKAPEQELAALRSALDKKTQKERAGVFFMSGSKKNTLLKIAAMFVLLAGLGLLIVKTSLNDKTNDLATLPVKDPVTDTVPAMVKNTQEDTNAVVARPADVKSEYTTTDAISSTATTSARKNASAGSYRYDNANNSRKLPENKTNQQSSLSNEIATADKISTQSETESKDEEKIAAVSAAPEKRALPPSAMNGVKEIRGSVTNEIGQPLPYASVTVNGTRTRALTDKEGNFNLKVADTTALLSANAAGYEVAFVPVNNAANNVIVLKESPALSEVVVTGQAQGRKKAPAKLIVESGDLEPEDGWIQYNEYVEARLKPIETNAKSKQRREVSLTFDVNENGEPINITVENSQCTQCNEEAIKLLKEGPKWKKGKKGKISFRF
jgi:hypothetical protein